MSGRSTASAEELASELLALKKASGLSFAQLGEKTHYAKSSWERWVNGKQFPPRAAVESIARLDGKDPAVLLALWDRADGERASADEASDGASDEAPVPVPVPAPAQDAAPARPGRRRALWISAVAGLLVAAAVAVAAVMFSGEEPESRPTRPVQVAGPATGCTGTACEGRDPKKMNCGADAVTERTGSIPKDLVIELRYSKACQAAWGRISFAQIGATVVVNNSDGAAQADVVHYDRDVYTPLIAAPDDGSVWVCAALPKDGQRSCTGRFIPSEEK
ncbi:DUF2690 domain-containing protein [Streptomyces sp. NPDC017868]|uniref:DUF2690 domain-containing protein n=1 Tax=Streptomyces sp. NPDC017868 TaxID=3365014 RepID=UPI00379C2198